MTRADSPPCVAIVEDRPEDRFFLAHALREVSADCQIFEFPSAEAALDFLHVPDRPRLDLILVDISMPRMSGFEFADAFQQLYPEVRGGARLCIISSSIDPNDCERALNHPAVADFLEKPARAARLADLLR
jgi:CheY-like chemotaxis protein